MFQLATLIDNSAIHRRYNQPVHQARAGQSLHQIRGGSDPGRFTSDPKSQLGSTVMTDARRPCALTVAVGVMLLCSIVSCSSPRESASTELVIDDGSPGAGAVIRNIDQLDHLLEPVLDCDAGSDTLSDTASQSPTDFVEFEWSSCGAAAPQRLLVFASEDERKIAEEYLRFIECPQRDLELDELQNTTAPVFVLARDNWIVARSALSVRVR